MQSLQVVIAEGGKLQPLDYLVEAHGRVDGHLPAEVVLDLVLLDGSRSHVGDQLAQAKNTHGAIESIRPK